jgi:hypothetical protein
VSASNQYKQGLIDKNSVDTLLSYNYNITKPNSSNFSGEHVEITKSTQNPTDLNLTSLLNINSTNSINTSLNLENTNLQNSANSVTDLKGHNNSLKYSNFNKGNNLITSAQGLDLQSTSNSSLPSLNENNEGRTFKFKDLKSPNLGFLSSEKNVRLLDEVSPSKFNASMQQGINNLDDLVSHSIGESILPNSYNIYSSSKNS